MRIVVIVIVVVVIVIFAMSQDTLSAMRAAVKLVVANLITTRFRIAPA